MYLLRVPLLVHTSLRNKSCTQAPASSCYSVWKWPSVLWLKSLQASLFSQRCGSGFLCLLRNFRSSSSSLLLPSFPLLSQLFSCNKWDISSSFSSQKPGGLPCISLTSSLQSISPTSFIAQICHFVCRRKDPSTQFAWNSLCRAGQL